MKSKEIMARREQIMNLIRSTGKMNTEDAAELFHVSKETIRQDFLYLAEQGIIQKVHGGAVILEDDRIESLSIRESLNFLPKSKIARKAMEFLPDGDCIVGMDMGSTVALLGSYAAHRKDLLVVTNSHRILQLMVSSSNRILSVGGEYNKEEMAYYPNELPSLIDNISFDIYFLGTSGVKGRNGICTKGFQESFIKNQLLQRSKRNIVLADSSKFQHTSLVEVAPWSKLDILITDSGIPDTVREQLQEKIQLIIAD